jgi:hypothetical protein
MRTHIESTNIDDLLKRGVRVRVFAGCDPTAVMAVGDLISYCAAPSITLRHGDGAKTSWSTDLPMEIIEPVSRTKSLTQYDADFINCVRRGYTEGLVNLTAAENHIQQWLQVSQQSPVPAELLDRDEDVTAGTAIDLGVVGARGEPSGGAS